MAERKAIVKIPEKGAPLMIRKVNGELVPALAASTQSYAHRRKVQAVLLEGDPRHVIVKFDRAYLADGADLRKFDEDFHTLKLAVQKSVQRAMEGRKTQRKK